jgi:hypothetical protein
MVHIDSIRLSFFNRYLIRSTEKIISIPKIINYEHFFRGIFSSRVPVSLVTQIDGVANVFISTFGIGKKHKEIQAVESNIHSIKSLLVGTKFSEYEINQIKVENCCAIAHLIGIPHIGYKTQAKEIINGLASIDGKVTIITNIKPIKLNIENKTTEYRDKNLIKDTSFIVSYSFFMSESDSNLLNANMNALISLLGSVYDSEHSEIKVKIETDKKAIKTLQRLLWGEQYYGTIMTTRELEAIFQIPDVYGIESIENPDLFIPTFSNKGIELGTIINKVRKELNPAYLDPNSIFQNMAIWGAIGYGKSTFIKNLVVKLHNQESIHSIIFDLHNEYRGIISSLNGSFGQDILILNPFIKTFSLNPLEISREISGKEKDIIIVETAENFISLLIQMWTLGEVQEQRCRKHIYELYKKTSNPTISQLMKLLEGDKLTKTKKDEDNLPSKMGKFIFGFYGEMFNQSNTSLDFDKIENATTIFELGELPIELRTFFVTVFLNQWWNHRRIKKSNEIIPNVLILDEFHHYDNMAIPKKILSEGRKYKQGIICSHQGPHQITDLSLLGELVRNTITKVSFKALYQRDIEIILASLGLKDRIWSEYLTRLELGEAIVTLKNISQPFKIHTAQFPKPSEKITNEQIKKINENLLHPQIIHEISTQKEPKLSVEESEFLKLLNVNPQSSAIDIIKQMKIMRSKGWKIKDRLVTNGLIIEENIRKGKGRPKKILQLTDEAYDLLDIEKKATPAHYGSEEHIMLIREFAGILINDNWKVTIEKDNCDIRAEKDIKLAIEVETCKLFNQEQILHNITRNLKWADKVLIVCPNQKNKARIQRLINHHKFEKVNIIVYTEMRNKILTNESVKIK